MFIYPFPTFDEHFTWTTLLLLTKAKVQKIPCDQLSVNMAARQMFGTCDLVWPVTNVTRATLLPREYDYSDRYLQKREKKQERKEIANLIISDISIQ